MERGEKRTYDMMEDPLIAAYELSEIELQNLKITAKNQPALKNAKDMDYNTKLSAIKSSSFVVSLISFSGTSVVRQGCGVIVETEGNMNTVITSLNLIRKSEGEGGALVDNNVVENVKVIISADDDNFYLAEVCGFDYFYNLLILRFKSRTTLRPATFAMIDDSRFEVDVPLRRHSNKAKIGDNVVILGRYFYEPYYYMAVPGLLSVERFSPKDFGCIELLAIKCWISGYGDGAPVISTSGDLLGIIFYNLSSKAPLLPINVISKFLEHYKKFGEMRHPSLGFEARNVHLSSVSTLMKLQKIFPNVLSVPNGLIIKKVFEGYTAESAGLKVGDVILSCDGSQIKSFLELWDLMFNKVGKEVMLEVARLDLKMVEIVPLLIDEASVDEEIYRWPRYDLG
ncbi:putative protease Do [Trifolium repens]|nr:putative protease Do [Trifolium repens]